MRRKGYQMPEVSSIIKESTIENQPVGVKKKLVYLGM